MFERVPEKLKSLPQWVVRKGKIPIDPRSGQGAKAGVPSTWATFEEAVSVRGYDGIGFQFASGSTLAGVDLDHVRDSQSGEIELWAQHIIKQLNSYTEISPSGTGVHIFVEAPDLTLHRNKTTVSGNQAIEIYNQNRYFTVTGNHLRGTPLEIRERGEKLQEIYRNYFPEKQLQQEQRKPAPADLQTALDKDPVLRAYWNGERPNGNESADDQGFMNKLAYWLNKDADQMEAAFLSSPYFSQKSGKHMKKAAERKDYLRRTIQKAIQDCSETAAEDNENYHSKQYAITIESFSKSGFNVTELEDQILSVPVLGDLLQKLDISVRLNILSGEIEVNGLSENFSRENSFESLLTSLEDIFTLGKMKKISRERITARVIAVADLRRYNPIQEMLKDYPWDGVSRFQIFFEILNIDKPEMAKYQTYLRKWLIQCVAMALNDERDPYGAEGVLTLQADQGAGKTTFFRRLALRPKWFVEGAVIDMNVKDTLIKATSAFICELGELESTMRKDQPALKAHITAAEDIIRAPYARTAVRRPRRTSYCGTVNSTDFLTDSTGSRRFWVVPIQRIDLDRLRSLSENTIIQLWAECYEIFKREPAAFRLTREEMQQLQQDNQQFEKLLPFEQELADKLDFGLIPDYWKWKTATEIAQMFTDGRASAKQVGTVLSSWERKESYPVKKRASHGKVLYYIPCPW